MGILDVMGKMLTALGLTIVTEGLVIMLVTQDTKKLKHSLLCNLITNPLLNLIAVVLTVTIGIRAYCIWVFTGEILVLLGEWRLYMLFGERSSIKAFLLSLMANASSLAAGIILNRLLG